MEIIVQARLLFNITTIIAKKVLNDFEVMINYIIAESLHVRRNNVMPFCSYHLPFSRMILLLSWVHIRLTLSSLLNSNTLHQGRWVWFALAPISLLLWWFSTEFICKSRQTTNTSEITKNLLRLFIIYIWQGWVVLHCCITLPLQTFTF